MTSAQIAATYPLLALLIYFGLKEGWSRLHRWYTNRRLKQQLRS